MQNQNVHSEYRDNVHLCVTFAGEQSMQNQVNICSHADLSWTGHLFFHVVNLQEAGASLLCPSHSVALAKGAMATWIVHVCLHRGQILPKMSMEMEVPFKS